MSATPTGNSEPSSPPDVINAVNAERMLLEYLRSRGYMKTEQAMREESEAGVPGTDSNITSSRSLAELLTALDVKGADDVLSLDPADKAGGFRELETWVDGSLDMYQVHRLSM